VLFKTSDLVVFYVEFKLQSLLVILQLFNLLAYFFVHVNVPALLVALVSVFANLCVFSANFKLKRFVAFV